MKNQLPYPGPRESFASWDFRCKEWESNRASFRRAQNSGRGSQKYDGEKTGCLTAPEKTIILGPGRLNKFEKWLYRNTPPELAGRICGHSMCASTYYRTVDRAFYDAAKTILGKAWKATPGDAQEVIEQFWKTQTK